MQPLTQQSIVDGIYDLHVERRKHEPRRNYLGGSTLGSPCDRQLWYGFRKAEQSEFDGRILRLFETGHREEDRMVKELQALGMEVLPVNPATGRQWEVTAIGGHVLGHFDGLVRGVPDAPTKWHLLETKTSNKKGFKRLAYALCGSCNKRVSLKDGRCPRCDGDFVEPPRGVEKVKPIHYAQMQTYMGLSRAKWDEWGLDGEPPSAALYLVHCKNDERLYAERVRFDEAFFLDLGRKAKGIIEAAEPPERIAFTSDYYLCRWCDFSDICHHGAVPRVDCRTCAHSTPRTDTEGGLWWCERQDGLIPDDLLTGACPDHLYIPPLLSSLGSVVDYDTPSTSDGCDIDWIEYSDDEGVRLKNVTLAHPADGLTSWQLRDGKGAA